MALTILSNLSYNGKQPNFERDRVATLEDLKAVKPENQEYDYGHIVFCEEDGKHYRFMHQYGTPDYTNHNGKTGWFQELATGGSDANVAAVDVGETVDDVAVEYATKGYVDSAIIGAINNDY